MTSRASAPAVTAFSAQTDRFVHERLPGADQWPLLFEMLTAQGHSIFHLQILRGIGQRQLQLLPERLTSLLRRLAARE